MEKNYSIETIKLKLENYCNYQERCHKEVIQKLYNMKISPPMIDVIVVHLIENNFLNEERFACNFVRGKYRYKHWGKIRLVNELKSRGITKYNIDIALKEIIHEEYKENFNKMTLKKWINNTDINPLKKRKKFCDYFLRKGFESNLVYEKVLFLESNHF